ncbi:Transcription factor tau 95 kDa subunit [Nakaseomyces bracarensis]|uniref:Transcription factor tau 95 kDa subunit n=1 Tax=Nakaseomyces bracarensis TaxID=273131 RepID=A0ABR4NPU7_9SACH
MDDTVREHTLDLPQIPSVEFPLNISRKQQSIVRAIDMCGGIEKVKAVFTTNGANNAANVATEKGLELFLNKLPRDTTIHDDSEDEGSWKDDADRIGEEVDQGTKNDSDFFNEHPIIGKRVPFRDDSVVLKISMPKGTMENNNGNVLAALKSLKDDEYCAEPVAIINNTVKFREMSDFQVTLDNVPAAREFQRSFGSLDWDNFKQFVDSVPDNDSRPFENINNLIIDRSVKSPNSDYQLPPPPRLSMVGYPLLYKYKGNPFAVKKENGTNEVKGSYIKNYQLFVHDMNDDVKVPDSPAEELKEAYEKAKKDGIYPGTKKDSKFYEYLEECISILRGKFNERPIWVKRHLDGIVPKRIHHTIKIALALLSYRFTMGPWRNTYIQFGVDPRTSSEYAKYQTEYFKIERRLLSSPMVRKNVPKPPPLVFESDTPGEIDSRFKFDGSRIPWYLMLQIDLLIQEPNILEVFEKVEYLSKPNEVTGWFTELDLAKIRRIVKYELGCMVQGKYDFNVYKLKYYKSMLFFKESMMTQKDGSIDDDGDVNMADGEQSNENVGEEDEEDNGVEAGEEDDTVREHEESESYSQLQTSQSKDISDEEEEEDTFDIRNASFKEVIDRIRQSDPDTAKKLSKQLEGLVNLSSL